MNFGLKLILCLFCGWNGKYLLTACDTVLLFYCCFMMLLTVLECWMKGCWIGRIRRPLFSHHRNCGVPATWTSFRIMLQFMFRFIFSSLLFFCFQVKPRQSSWIQGSTETTPDTAGMRHTFWGHSFNWSGIQMGRKMRDSSHKNPVTFIWESVLLMNLSASTGNLVFVMVSFWVFLWIPVVADGILD